MNLEHEKRLADVKPCVIYAISSIFLNSSVNEIVFLFDTMKEINVVM